MNTPQPKSRMEEIVEEKIDAFFKNFRVTDISSAQCRCMDGAKRHAEMFLRNHIVSLIETYDRETEVVGNFDDKNIDGIRAWRAYDNAQSAARAKWKGEKKSDFTVNVDNSVKNWFISEK